jgi:toxin ParE1/3/4
MERGPRPDRGGRVRAVSKPLRTEAEADRELEEAIRRYEGQRPGLGAEFLAAVDEVLERIQRLPNIGAPIPRIPVDLAALRRAPLHRFPYHVVYLETTVAIQVLAFAHNRRRPGYWQARSERLR